MSRFSTLPTEIHHIIISQLDYTSLIDLTKSNRYFHKLPLANLKKTALYQLEQNAPGTPRPDRLSSKLIHHTHLPCYNCLRFLHPDVHFQPEQTKHSRALGQRHAKKRRCIRCVLHEEHDRICSKSSLHNVDGISYIDCVVCQNTKRYLLNVLHEQAWARGETCMDCFWFKETFSREEGREGQFIVLRENLFVRVPVMDGKTGAMLFGEIQKRTYRSKVGKPSRDTQRITMSIMAAIKKAARLPNIRVDGPWCEEWDCEQLGEEEPPVAVGSLMTSNGEQGTWTESLDP